MSEQAASTLGAYLKELRLKRGLTLAEAARQIGGLTPSFLFYLEEGQRRQPKPEYLHRLARFYRVLVEDLYALAGYTPAEELPDLPAYLRTKYDLSDELIRELETYKDFLTERSDGENPAINQPPRRSARRRT
jgi:transcriptional regulator with XRE-family HTH domain